MAMPTPTPTPLPNHAEESTNEIDTLYTIISAVCWCIVTPFAILVNLFSLLVVYRSPATEDVSQTFIASSSAAVLLLTVCQAFPTAIITASGGTWIFGDEACNAQSLLLMGAMVVLVFIMLIFSMERFVFLAYPLKYPHLITKVRSRWAIVVTVLVSSIIIVITGHLVHWRGTFIPSWHACVPYTDSESKLKLFLGFYFIFKLAPAVAAYSMHCSLLLIARRHLRLIIATTPSLPPGDTGSGPAHLVGSGPATSRDSVAPTEAVRADRRLQLNSARCVLLSIFTAIFLCVDLLPDLAIFYRAIPYFLVMPSNALFLIISCFVPVAHILCNIRLKRTARQIFAPSSL